jgi:hypothetical protein
MPGRTPKADDAAPPARGFLGQILLFAEYFYVPIEDWCTFRPTTAIKQNLLPPFFAAGNWAPQD